MDYIKKTEEHVRDILDEIRGLHRRASVIRPRFRITLEMESPIIPSIHGVGTIKATFDNAQSYRTTFSFLGHRVLDDTLVYEDLEMITDWVPSHVLKLVQFLHSFRDRFAAEIQDAERKAEALLKSKDQIEAIRVLMEL